MRYHIENEFLYVEIDTHGAELVHVFDKENKREVLWQAERPFWNRHAPILFPNVGKHYENVYCINGKTYPTSQHGFARDKEFKPVDATEHAISFELQDDEETRKIFPWKFSLIITYGLTEKSLSVSYRVKNKSQEIMYFTIGGHPGFSVPVLPDTQRNQYHLIFKNGPVLKYKLIYENSGNVWNEKEYELSLENAGEFYRYPVKDDLFDRDALVFDEGQIQYAGIAYPDGTPYIEMECEGFTHFGIWSMKAGTENAPFVCLEPWMGRCDNYGFSEEISKKKGIIKLDRQEDFMAGYAIKIH
ncbi:MAG: aldose 1-epimerase family protein [Blautia sp.]